MHGYPLKIINRMLNLRKPNIFALFLFIAFLNLHSQESSLLYQINGNGLHQPSYLFGTIHMIPKSDFFLTDSMIAKFNTCDALITEIPMDLSLKDQIALAQRMFLPNGNSYKDYMDQDAFNRFYSFLVDSLNIRQKKVERYIRIKPVFLSGILMKEMLGKIKIYEMEFHKMAKKRDMIFLSLETAKEQMNIVDSISMEMQFKDMDKSSSLQTEYNKLLKAYKRQDFTNLCNLLDDDSDFEKIKSVMLDNRNRNWLNEIVDMISGQACFIAVGAAHLCGPEGLIMLLKKAGYNITAIQ